MCLYRYGISFLFVGRHDMFLVEATRSNQTAALRTAARYQISWVVAAITGGHGALLTRASNELLLPTKKTMFMPVRADRGSNRMAKISNISSP